MAGFFDTFKETPTGSFIGTEEKKELIDGGEAFPVLAVDGPVLGKYGERYIMTITLDGENRLLPFPTGSVGSRDNLLAQLQEYLKTEGAEPPVVKLEQVGRAVLIKQA